MKQLSLLVSLAIILVFTGCTKEVNHLNSEKNSNPKFDSIVQFLKTNFPDQVSILKLDSIRELQYNHQNIGFQIFNKSTSKKFLLLRKEFSGYSGSWIDMTALQEKGTSKYSGKIHLKSLGDKITTDLIVENNKVVQVQKLDKSLSRIIRVNPGQISKNGQNNMTVRDGSNLQDVITLPEVIIVINHINYLSLYWLFDIFSPFNHYYMLENIIIEGNGGPSGGNGSVRPKNESESQNVIAVPVFYGPKTPIKNLVDELKCFTVNSKSTYSISVNVNQPRPNSRDKVDPSNDFQAGHTFLSLEQVNSDGSKIVRNVGFYPQNSVYPGKFEDQSIFGEDSDSPFSVSLKIGVSGQELNTVLNSLISQQSTSYDLEIFNCVSSVATALNKIDVHLPMTSSGIEYLFKGVNPGDLGQDIRNLDLNKFQAKNGNRKVDRKTSDKNDIKPLKKNGSC